MIKHLSFCSASTVRLAKEQLVSLGERAAKVSVEGNRSFTPGWHLALDLESMNAGATCTWIVTLSPEARVPPDGVAETLGSSETTLATGWHVPEQQADAAFV